MAPKTSQPSGRLDDSKLQDPFKNYVKDESGSAAEQKRKFSEYLKLVFRDLISKDSGNKNRELSATVFLKVPTFNLSLLLVRNDNLSLLYSDLQKDLHVDGYKEVDAEMLQ